MRTIEQNKEAIINFREALLDDEVLYNAFLASIESALKGSSPTDSIDTVSRAIAGRIIGEE